MNSESPQTKVKSCNSCRRSLPTFYFGLRKFSQDGYNPCCKECRNFRRRRAYQSPNDSSDAILPLNEHNRHFLWTLPDSTTKAILIGLDLKTLKPAEVFFQRKREREFYLTINITSGAQYTHVHGGLKDSFIDFVLPLLIRLNIRLFHPSDSVVLSNWGLNQASVKIKDNLF